VLVPITALATIRWPLALIRTSMRSVTADENDESVVSKNNNLNRNHYQAQPYM